MTPDEADLANRVANLLVFALPPRLDAYGCEVPAGEPDAVTFDSPRESGMLGGPARTTARVSGETPEEYEVEIVVRRKRTGGR